MKTFYLNSREPIQIPGFSGARRSFTEGQNDVESITLGKDGAAIVRLTNGKGAAATVRVMPQGVYLETKEKNDGTI
jgi:hypothetical protein